jgi:DNA helicase-2/ATP-dependent DNA helicase PcrA
MSYQLGSGKTRVITHRVLFLLQQEKIPPETVIVTTFTNKAAAEMKERLYKMAPHDIASIDKLILGTFHHIGALYLRKYGTVVGLKNNFQVLDSEDSKKILNMVVKEHFPMAATLKVNFGSIISNAKAQNWTEKDIEATYGDGDPLKQLAVGVFREYNRELRRTNSVDFDDLLVFTLMLFQVWPHLSSSIKHVIIDEFQDTNAIQYMLMERFASVCQKFTVVCDPDQSIYAWRNADVTNLIKFQEKFKEDSESIFLEQNYRSTKSIISASLSVIREDKERVDKGLWTENWEGTSVVMQEFQNGRQQAEMIARNIEMLHDSSAGVLNYNDFAVLYRTNKEGNALQQALLMKNLPFRVRGGVSFFDRKEIKDLLCYIKFANNPYDFFSFDRIINVPPRGVGAVTIKQLVDGYNSDESSLYEHVRSRAKGKTKIIKFMNMIKEVQSMIKNNCTLEEILLYCLESLEYVAYVRTLDKAQKKKTVISATETEDETNREKNIEELIAFLKDFESGFRGSEIETHFRMLQEEDKTVTELDPSTLPQELSTTKLVETLFEKVTLDAAPDALKSGKP